MRPIFDWYMQQATVFDWCIDRYSASASIKYTVELDPDGCHASADLLPEDHAVIGRPDPGDRVHIVVLHPKSVYKRRTLIVGSNGIFGPSAEKYKL